MQIVRTSRHRADSQPDDRDALALLRRMEIEDFQGSALLRLGECEHEREQLVPDQGQQQPVARPRRLLVVEMRRDISARQMRPDGGEHVVEAGPRAGRRRVAHAAVERMSFRLQPGDMIVVNSGHFLHRVTPVVGETVRWTACSFMAESKAGDRIYCWG